MNCDAENSGEITSVDQLQSLTDEELLEMYLILMDNIDEIRIGIDENVIVDYTGPLTLKRGSTSVETNKEGLTIKIDSELCKNLHENGATIAGSAIVIGLTSAIVAAFPVFATPIGSASISLIGSAVTKAIFDYIGNGLHYDEGIIVKVKLIGYVFGIPHPYPPTITAVYSQ